MGWGNRYELVRAEHAEPTHWHVRGTSYDGSWNEIGDRIETKDRAIEVAQRGNALLHGGNARYSFTIEGCAFKCPPGRGDKPGDPLP